MMIRLMRFVLLFYVSIGGGPLAAQTGNLKFQVTGANITTSGDIRVNAVIGPFEDGTWIRNTQNQSHNSRDDNGHYTIEFKNIDLPQQDFEILVFGQMIGQDGGTLGYISLKRFSNNALSDRNYLSDRLNIWLDRQRAFKESYPFSIGNDYDLIDSSNIDGVLKSIRELIEEKFISSDGGDNSEWERIHQFFRANTRFFSVTDDLHLSKILTYLSDFYKRDDQEFSLFYARLLNEILLLDISGRPVSQMTLGAYVFAELRNMYSSLQRPLPVRAAREILETYSRLKQYDRCLDLARLIFLSTVRGFVLFEEIYSEKENVNAIRNTMLASTVCAQNYFVHESDSPGASRGDIAGAAQFIALKDFGIEFIQGFVNLFYEMEQRGFMPRERIPITNELSKFYEVYYRDFAAYFSDEGAT